MSSDTQNKNSKFNNENPIVAALETSKIPETQVDMNMVPRDHEGGIDYDKISQEQALQLFGVDSKLGLCTAEVQKRLQEYGPNALPSTEKSKLLKFVSFLWNPLSWCMEIAAILSIILLDYVDFILIIVLLLLNAGIGFYEETAADNAIKALTASLAPKAKVLRDGETQTIDAIDLVPGDIILIRLGDIIPSDCKILGDDEVEPLQIDQAALTGESLPVKRFPGKTVYSGSTVKQGEALALVYATGAETFFGKAAALIDGTESTGHLQTVMTTIGAVCIVTILVWVVIELGVQFGGRNLTCALGSEGSCPTLSNILVIIVGGIPIAMPTVLSVTLALGAFNLATHGAIVTRLTAIEELAGMDMLCSDKTGTLTLNELSVDKPNLEPCGRFTQSDITLYAALSAKIENDEPIDVCVHDACDEKDTIWQENECLKYVPFNPTDKRTVATIKVKADGRVFRCAKGAPQVALQMAHNYEEIRAQFEGTILEYASRGYRALGVAYSEGANNDKWEFVGLIPLFDPPRHDTKDTVEKCIEFGIGVKMITGDQLPIGVETARQLGMGTNFHTTEVLKEGMNGSLVGGSLPLNELIETADGFAEVFPEHKYEIVKRLQDMGHICGMTGDGVNDAPALKKGDIGIAVSDATDAARAAADIVLTEPGLGVIVEAIIGARKIFQRMKSYAKYTVAMTFRICFTFGLLTVIYDWNFPTILIVLLAIFNDGAMISLSKDRVKPSPNPDAWFLHEIFTFGLVYGLYLTLSSWVLFYVASHTDFGEQLNLSYNLQYPQADSYCTAKLLNQTEMSQCVVDIIWERQSRLRALMYCQVSISGIALIFVTRTRNFSFLSRPGVLLVVAFVVSQIASSLIAGFGFNGYPAPVGSVTCSYCEGFSGQGPNSTDPRSVRQASLLGCGTWVIVAWIWSIVWFILLDPIKFVLTAIFEGKLTNIFSTSLISKDVISSNQPSTAFSASRGSVAAGRASEISSGRPRASRVVRGSVY
eukprot:Pgem_evm1s16500